MSVIMRSKDTLIRVIEKVEVEFRFSETPIEQPSKHQILINIQKKGRVPLWLSANPSFLLKGTRSINKKMKDLFCGDWTPQDHSLLEEALMEMNHRIWLS